MNYEAYAELLIGKIEEQKEDLIGMSRTIWEHPEIGYQEFVACKTLTDYLKAHNFEVTVGINQMETAFYATYKSEKPGSKVVFMAEYDALFKIDHACGHNLFCSSAAGAAIALSSMMEELGGELVVLGTPAEEGTVPNYGSKGILAKAGYFDDADIALICHAEGEYVVERVLVASANVKASFTGKSAHAGGSPEEGINALTAGVLTVNNVNACRQHLLPGDIVNSIITEGGILANTIPDLCEMSFSIRAKTIASLDKLIDMVRRCVEASALVTGCTYTYDVPTNISEDLLPNHELGMVFAHTLENHLGVTKYKQGDIRNYAWDAGNVSYVCPVLAPYIKIGPETLVGHTVEFCDASNSEAGYAGMILAAKALAMTACEYMLSPELQAKVKEEFANQNR